MKKKWLYVFVFVVLVLGLFDFQHATLRARLWTYLLQCETTWIQNKAVSRLSSLRHYPIVSERLVPLLLSSLPSVRVAAVRVCSSLDDVTTKKILEKLALHDKHQKVRRDATYSLGERPFQRSSAEVLVKALSDPSNDVKVAAMVGLGRFGLKAQFAARHIFRLVSHHNWTLYICAIETIGKLGTKDKVILSDLKKRLLYGSNFLIKRELIRTLFLLSPSDLGDTMLRVFTHKSKKVRAYRHLIMNLIIDEHVNMPALRKELEKNVLHHPPMSFISARALAAMGEDSLPFFQRILKHNDRYIRELALRSLFWLDGPVVTKLLVESFKKYTSTEERLLVLRGLCRRRDKVRKHLRWIARHSKGIVKTTVLRILAKRKGKIRESKSYWLEKQSKSKRSFRCLNIGVP